MGLGATRRKKRGDPAGTRTREEKRGHVFLDGGQDGGIKTRASSQRGKENELPGAGRPLPRRKG